MSSANQNLSAFNKNELPDAAKMRFGIVVAEWNAEITESLYNGAEETLKSCGVQQENIFRVNVPGSFELTAGAKYLTTQKKVDAVICLGCVIQGETRHFEFICQAVAQGLTNLTLISSIPYIFGVLTTDNIEQARARAGGPLGNKGIEAAVSAIKMAALKLTAKTEKRIGFS
jgi:6,7-dimethyl-8-ribityllumazine synthase